LAQAGLWYDAVAAAADISALDQHAALDTLMNEVGLTSEPANTTAKRPAVTGPGKTGGAKKRIDVRRNRGAILDRSADRNAGAVLGIIELRDDPGAVYQRTPSADARDLLGIQGSVGRCSSRGRNRRTVRCGPSPPVSESRRGRGIAAGRLIRS
jgi:hypothetical protein